MDLLYTLSCSWSSRACRLIGLNPPSGRLRADRALTSRLIFLAGVTWWCWRSNKSAFPHKQEVIRERDLLYLPLANDTRLIGDVHRKVGRYSGWYLADEKLPPPRTLQ